MECYVCKTLLTIENETSEHIIINAIGGVLKSKSLLCKECNKTFGHNVDLALAEQLKETATLLQVKRNRGKSPSIIVKKDNDEYLIDNKGDIKFNTRRVEKTINPDNSITFNMTLPNKKELNATIKNLIKKYPKHNFSDSKPNIETKYKEVGSLPLEIEFGEENVLKAVCKTAINYYMYCTEECNHINHLIPYIKGEQDSDCTILHYDKNFSSTGGFFKVYHLLHLYGSAKEKILYCYIEFFSSFKYLVILNMNYTGEDIEYSYCHNPIENKEYPIKGFNIHYNRTDIQEFLSNSKNGPNLEVVIQCFRHLTIEIENVRFNTLKDSLLKEALNRVTQNLNDEKLTSEQIDIVMEEMEKELLPLLIKPETIVREENLHYIKFM